MDYIYSTFMFQLVLIAKISKMCDMTKVHL